MLDLFKHRPLTRPTFQILKTILIGEKKAGLMIPRKPVHVWNPFDIIPPDVHGEKNYHVTIHRNRARFTREDFKKPE